MKRFLFRARDRHQKLMWGAIIAETEEEAVAELKAACSRIEYVVPSASIIYLLASKEYYALDEAIRELIADIKSIFSKGMDEALSLFLRQLSILYGTGIPLKRAIEMLRHESWPRQFTLAIGQIDRDLDSGIQISRSMEKYPRLFPLSITNMIAIGETSSTMPYVLEKAAQIAEEELRIKKRIATALIYPSILFCASLFVASIILFFILPQMERLTLAMNVQTLWFIRCAFNSINFLKNPLVLCGILELLVIAIVFFYFWVRLPAGRYAFDSFLLRVPFLGKFLLHIGISRLAYNFMLLIGSGVNLLSAMKILPGIIGNASLARSLVAATMRIVDGCPISDSFEFEKRFPSIFTTMLRIGETSGNLEKCLSHICRFYDQEVEVSLNSFLTIFEPLMILFMGLIVGSMFLTFFPLIYQLSKGLGG